MSYPESPWSYTDFSFLAAIALGMGAIICVVSLAKEFVLVALALLVVVCFLLGSIPWGVIISKSVFHTDIREHGSGNIGTTNAMRTMGKMKRQGRTQGRTPEVKKAIVTLKADSKGIPFFEGMAEEEA